MLEQTDDELKHSLCKNLNTTLERMQQDVKTLKEWTKTQLHLPQCSTDTLLTAFILHAKNNMDTAKRNIDVYYSTRGRIPAFFNPRDPLDEKMQEANTELRFYYLPKMTPQGCRVVLGSFTTGETKHFDMVSVIRKGLMLIDVHLHREAFITGLYLVFDASNVSFFHVTKMSPFLCRDIVYCLQGVFPVILKGFVMFNASPANVFIMSVLKPLMKRKLRQRVHVFTEGPEVLEQFFPKDILPKDYGGREATSLELNEQWFDCLKKNRDWLMNEGSSTTSEEKRIKQKLKLETDENHKTFKNLTID